MMPEKSEFVEGHCLLQQGRAELWQCELFLSQLPKIACLEVSTSAESILPEPCRGLPTESFEHLQASPLHYLNWSQVSLLDLAQGVSHISARTRQRFHHIIPEGHGTPLPLTCQRLPSFPVPIPHSSVSFSQLSPCLAIVGIVELIRFESA